MCPLTCLCPSPSLLIASICGYHFLSFMSLLPSLYPSLSAQVVRATWGREGLFGDAWSIRTIFLLGVPKKRTGFPLWDRLLAYESQTFQDILLWDFDDTFFNLTLKETHFLKWVDSSCPGVRCVCVCV